jgi:hypothetical protein
MKMRILLIRQPMQWGSEFSNNNNDKFEMS